MDAIKTVSEQVRYYLTNSSLRTPYIVINEKWFSDIEENEIVSDPENQISFTYVSDTFGNQMNTSDGFIRRSSTFFSEDADILDIARGKVAEIEQMEVESPNGLDLNLFVWDPASGEYYFSPAGIILLKYIYILEPGENKVPR